MSKAQALDQAIPDGWYEDPEKSDMQRWWSGTDWTNHVRYGPAPQPSAIAIAPTLEVAAPAPQWQLPTNHTPQLAPTPAFAAHRDPGSGFDDFYVPMRNFQPGVSASVRPVPPPRSSRTAVLWVVTVATLLIAAGVAAWLLLPR